MFKIYKLISPNTDLIYIGITKQSLLKRLKEHIWDFNKRPNWTKSSEIFKYGDVSIELLEETDDKYREGFYTELYKDICVNKQNGMKFNTRKEYNVYYRTTEQRKEYDKNYQKTKNRQNYLAMVKCLRYLRKLFEN